MSKIFVALVLLVPQICLAVGPKAPPEWAAVEHDYEKAVAADEKRALAAFVRQYRMERAWAHRQRLRASSGVPVNDAYVRAAMLWAATR